MQGSATGRKPRSNKFAVLHGRAVPACIRLFSDHGQVRVPPAGCAGLAGFFPVAERGGERRRTRLTFTELWTNAARGRRSRPRSASAPPGISPRHGWGDGSPPACGRGWGWAGTLSDTHPAATGRASSQVSLLLPQAGGGFPYFSSSGFRYWPVKLRGSSTTCSGVPAATISPPFTPPSGPRSTIQSAVLMTSRLCSITTTLLP